MTQVARYDKKRFLFVCVENAGRSQMAEAFARLYGGDRIEMWSAGSRSGKEIHPEVVHAMREKDIDLRGRKPKALDSVPQVAWDYLITMGCGDACPSARAVHREDWELPNPKGQGLDAVRSIRDEIERRVKALLKRAEI
jgi:protein-tyrosine-phosphatase